MRSLVNDKRAVVAQRLRYQQYSVVMEEVGCPAWACAECGKSSSPLASLTQESAVAGPSAARRIPG